MNHERFDTLAAVYALGALDGEELVEFEAHLSQGCPRCTATLRESHETLAALARSSPPAVPPPEVKQALLSQIAEARPGAPSRRARRRGGLAWAVGTAAAAIVAAALTGAFVAGRYEAQLGQMAREAAATRQRLQGEVAALNDQLAVYRSAADLLRDPATQVVTLRGLGPSPGATGRIVWHHARGGQLFAANLPPAPAGKAYELWTIGAGPPRPAGLFRVDADGRATHRVEPGAGGAPVKIFAVTLEPEGGVPAPTGPMVLASTK
jgi:anti-sigma-K factor RskA